MQQGSLVEIRYIGRGQGKVEQGVVQKIHDDGDMDIRMEYPSYGIRFSVPASIVHPVHISAQFQVRLDALLGE